MHHSHLLTILCAPLVALCCWVSSPSLGAVEDLTDAEVIARLQEERPEDRAIRDGLAWLRQQQLSSGALTEDKHAMALTSLGIMAHLAAGYAPHDPEHGPWLRRSLRYVLSMQSDNGYFGERDSSRMYGHGIALIMLAEALGMSDDPELEVSLHDALTRAVAISVNAALVEKKGPHQGGWRYHPHADDSDLSLSGWQLMGLHAAQQVGITVPEEVIHDAVAYARRLTSDEGEVAYNKPGGSDRPGLRGLGMLSFAIGGAQDDPVVDRIATRILSDAIEWRGRWLFYRIYYDAVGMARSRPQQWQQYRQRLIPLVVEQQKADGSWPTASSNNEGNHGPIYRSSLCLLALAVDRHVLPSYQR